jgi:hypothetical protein
MWGIFLEQKRPDIWTFLTEGDAKIEITCRAYPPPVCNFIKYHIQVKKNGVIILDAQRIPWNTGMSRLCFDHDNGKIKDLPTAKKIPSQLAGWINFDIDFHLKRLLPNRNPSMYINLIKNGDYDTLVKKIGGVDPLYLRRFVPHDSPLIAEAMVLFHFTNAMKVYSTIWLTPKMCSRYLTIELTETATKLTKEGYIVKKINSSKEGDFIFALQWALENHIKNKMLTRNFDLLIDSGVVHKSMLLPQKKIEEEEVCMKIKTLDEAIYYIEMNSDSKTIVFSRNGTISIKNTCTCIQTKNKESSMCLIKPYRNNISMVNYNGDYVAYNNEDIFPYIECLGVLPFNRVLTLLNVKNIDKIFTIIECSEDFRWIPDIKLLGSEKTERIFIHIWKK